MFYCPSKVIDKVFVSVYFSFFVTQYTHIHTHIYSFCGKREDADSQKRNEVQITQRFTVNLLVYNNSYFFFCILSYINVHICVYIYTYTHTVLQLIIFTLQYK